MSGGKFMTGVLRSPAAGRAASFFIAAYIRSVAATSRRDEFGREHVDPLLGEQKGFILAFWHQRLLMGPVMRRETAKRVHMLISAHRDGEIIADAVKGFGIELIRGSAADPKKPQKNKSGASAVAQMIDAIDAGGIVGVTPDGPKGPARLAKIGAIRLAALSGAPIIPAAYSASRGPFLGTWDRFLLPLPFSRIAFAARAPIHIERKASAGALEQARQKLEAELNEATAEADRAAGRDPGEYLAAYEGVKE